MSLTRPVSGEFRPTIPILNAGEVTRSADDALAEASRRMREIEGVPLDASAPESVLDAWDGAAIVIEDAFGPISILNSVHPDKSVRDAGDDALVREATFMTEVFQSEALYERVRRVQPQSIAQKKLREDLLESFEDSGVSLPLAKRQRFRQISERLTELGQEFAKNIRESSTRLRFTPAECQGLPQPYLDRVPHDGEGNIVVGFDSPDYFPFMTNALSDAARKRYYVAYTNRGTPRNLDIMDEIVALRREIAALYSLPSYAHYVTRRGMVENPETVRRFLDDVRKVVTGAEERELVQLAGMKARMGGTPVEQASISRWEASFYRERLREERFAVDQEALRTFFPTGGCVDWMLDVSERLYGIRFERAQVPVWHDSVLYLDVLDETSGDRIGGIYLDLYPRDGKYKHAAAWPVRGVSRRSGRKPISVLVTNLNGQGLTHDELETLLHEFGHVLHGVLSETDYVGHSGTSVEWRRRRRCSRSGPAGWRASR